MSQLTYFSHASNFTGYMEKILKMIAKDGSGSNKTALDFPAGNGLMCDGLKKQGFAVTGADINGARKDFVKANLEEKLPFFDNEFNYTLCLEGLEHLLAPAQTIKELVRVTKEDGYIIISTPNIQNAFSRFIFLFTGEFYQFNPRYFFNINRKELCDRGHISPLSYYQLVYLFKLYHCKLVDVEGDRYKRKALAPFYLAVAAINYLWFLFSGKRRLEIYKFSFSTKLLLSRSIILKFKKNQPGL